jgi:glycosyltransferase involved in cell wall biosynthesis
MSVKKQSKMWLRQDNKEAMNLPDIKKQEYLADIARFAFLSSKSSNVASFPELSFHSMQLERRIFELEHSLSWKITSPLRAIVRKILRLKMNISKIFTSKRNPNLLSVVVTSFNQPRHQLEKCIESILSQTFTNFRLLIWDDGSTNVETLDYLKSLTHDIDTRVNVIFEVNRGVVSARNLAAQQCHSKYIAFLDPDDYLEVTFFEKVIIFAESHGVPGPAIVNTDVNVHGHQEINVWQTGELSWPEVMVENSLPICSLIRLSTFNGVRGFSESMNDGFEDWELWTRLASRGYRSKRIAEPLFHYSYQQSAGRDAEAKSKSEKLQNRIKVLNSKRPSGEIKIGKLSDTPSWLLDRTLTMPYQDKSTVFIFVPWLPKAGGAETFLKSLALGLQANGRTVCFLATKEGFASPSSSDFLGITPYVYDLPKFLSPSSFLSFVNNLMSRVPHSIVLNSGSTWLYENLSSLSSVESGAARCYDILYNPIGHLPNFLSHQEHFTGVVPVYENLGQILTEYFQVSPRVKTIPVGIDEIPLSLNENRQKANVGWLGRLSSEKRPEWFVRAALSIEADVIFSLAGDGDLWEQLLHEIPGNNKGDIQLLGHVDIGTKYIASLDLLVNTSMIEGIAVTAMEAISQGIPVLAPRVGGMSELIIDGVNGYLFDPDNFKDFLAKLTKILSEPNELSRLKESTRNARLPSKFSAVEMIASFEDLFLESKLNQLTSDE